MRASAPLIVVLFACGSSHGSGVTAGASGAGNRGLSGSAAPADSCVAVSERCTDERSTISAKFSESDAQRWQTEIGAHDVVVRLNDGAPPACSTMQRLAFHEVSQACVKQLIQRLNGSVVDGSTSWLLNLFEARLNWEQIQRVAEHPQVQSIENSDSRTPPPASTPHD